MLNCYETARGDFSPAHALTPDEAVDLHRRGVFLAADFELLTQAARRAVTERFEAEVSGGGRCHVVYVHFGVRQATRAHQGRA